MCSEVGMSNGYGSVGPVVGSCPTVENGGAVVTGEYESLTVWCSHEGAVDAFGAIAHGDRFVSESGEVSVCMGAAVSNALGSDLVEALDVSTDGRDTVMCLGVYRVLSTYCVSGIEC